MMYSLTVSFGAHLDKNFNFSEWVKVSDNTARFSELWQGCNLGGDKGELQSWGQS